MSTAGEFKAIAGYEEEYSIDEKGNVWSLRSSKFIRAVENNCGYLTICFWKGGKSKRFSIHRLLALTFIPNPENHPCVNHLDGNKKNNSLENLQWCTHSENGIHASRMGLLPEPWNKGKHLPEAVKAKLSAALKGRVSPCGMKGKNHSEESKRKLRESNLGKSRNKGKIAYQYPVFQLSLDGTFIKEWANGKLAAAELGISHGNLVACLKGKRNKTGGFKWQYK